MILPVTLTIVSYILGTYFAYQGLRNPIDKPVVYNNEVVLLSLIMVFGWAPIMVAIYFAFKISLLSVLMLLLLRFLILPTAFNNLFISLMNK
jgi:hypothetical protein